MTEIKNSSDITAQNESGNSKQQERFSHTCFPIYDAESKILILGTFPSIKSRETMFYYGHPQNRFWKVLAAVFHEDVPQSQEEKISLLLRNHVALWDVIESCEITGSSDTSIRNVVPNDITKITQHCRIHGIYGNGATTEKLYNRYVRDKTGMEIVRLPSTSPANATFSLERLIEYWSVIRRKL